MANQTMSGQEAQRRIDAEVQNFAEFLLYEHWTLEHAHQVLRESNLDLFKTAALAKAIACFQCSEE